MLNCVLHGISYATAHAAYVLLFCVVLRFGSFLITLPEDNVAHIRFVDIFVTFSALLCGSIGTGQFGAYAPNYARGRVSANRIFHLLDRKPLIDSYSQSGEKLVSRSSLHASAVIATTYMHEQLERDNINVGGGGICGRALLMPVLCFQDEVRGEIATQDLYFNYPSRPDVPVLRGLDIVVKSGDTFALVGPSGYGKSTVVSLLERFYDPLSGSLTLDGNNIACLNVSWLRSQIGIVSQEPVLFDRSIADNIRYGANYREVSLEEVVEAAKAANIHKFVEALPQVMIKPLQ